MSMNERKVAGRPRIYPCVDVLYEAIVPHVSKIKATNNGMMSLASVEAVLADLGYPNMPISRCKSVAGRIRQNGLWVNVLGYTDEALCRIVRENRDRMRVVPRNGRPDPVAMRYILKDVVGMKIGYSRGMDLRRLYESIYSDELSSKKPVSVPRASLGSESAPRSRKILPPHLDPDWEPP